jgi:hypothetical protein
MLGAMKLSSLLSVLVLVLVVGCKGDKDKTASPSGGGKVASCLMESVQSCREYRDGNLAGGADSLQKLCTAVVSTAKFSETACPTAKVIATCAKPEGKDFYYEGYFDSAQKIEDSCKQSGGTFATK